MDNVNKIKVVSVAFLLLVVSINFSIRVGNDENMRTRQTEAAGSKIPIIDAAKRLFSLPIASDSWILKVKALFQQGWLSSSPPNLDFRGVSGRDESVTDTEGATVKVKEAVVKSLDKSKATVEDSARSAAKFADDAVDKTVKKLKKTLSQQEVGADHEAEL